MEAEDSSATCDKPSADSATPFMDVFIWLMDADVDSEDDDAADAKEDLDGILEEGV